jgi:hypothetical protein
MPINRGTPRIKLCARGRYHFISPTGSDSNTGSSGRPWLTLSYANSKMVSGDTLYAIGGTYTMAASTQVSLTVPNTNFVAYGNGTGVPTFSYPANSSNGNVGAIRLAASQILFSGFRLTSATSTSAVSTGNQQGINILGDYCTVSNCTIDAMPDDGINIVGNYNTITSNTIHHTCLLNYGGATGSAHGTAVGIHGTGNNSPFVGNYFGQNTIYNNWGEGIYGYFGVSNTIMEFNTVYNNYNFNLALANTQGGIIRNNLSYYVSAPAGMTSAAAIFVGWETDTGDPNSNNNSIYNNFVYGGPIYLGDISGANQPMTNVFIYFNSVVVPSPSTATAFTTASSAITGLSMYNNIFDGAPFTGFQLNGGTHGAWGYNNWYQTPSDATPTSSDSSTLSIASNVIGDATTHMAQTGGAPAAGTLTTHWFDLTTGSADLAAGVATFTSVAPTNYYGTARPSPPNIGAY